MLVRQFEEFENIFQHFFCVAVDDMAHIIKKNNFLFGACHPVGKFLHDAIIGHAVFFAVEEKRWDGDALKVSSEFFPQEI